MFDKPIIPKVGYSNRNLKKVIFIFLLFAAGVVLLWPEREFRARAIQSEIHNTVCINGQPGRMRYAVILDAGSTGTRVHVFRFLFCDDQVGRLEGEDFHRVKPGLSSFSDGQSAAKSIEPLLKFALDKVPRSLYACTPIAVKATAGLRLLPEKQRADLLQSVHNKLSSCPFLKLDKPDSPAVSVIDGGEEGTSAWMTVNFLLDFLDKGPTSIILDLGGASTQIAFESSFSRNEKYYKMVEINGKAYSLYQHSFLGYGLMEARKKIFQSFLDQSVENKHDGFSCIAEGHTVEHNNTTITGSKTDFQSCLKIVKSLFGAQTKCDEIPCTFGGVHFPDFNQMSSIYAFSFFYERLKAANITGEVTTENIRQAGITSCTSNATDPFICADLTFIYALMKNGYRLKDDTRINLVEKINGFEAGWCLGAAIKLLQEGSSCQENQ